jgi:anaerobic magnesium-protoporphyrin IX monomethyl ester cyclase
MKILLISPPIENTIASVMPKELEEGLDFLPPLGLMYIAAYLEKETSHQVEILDCPVEKMGHNQLREEIKKRNPDIVGMTAMTFTLIDVVRAARTAKEINPKIKIILGGPHVIIFPEETIKIPEIDFLVLGEGEAAIKPLLENIGNSDNLKKIRGLVFKQENNFINTGRVDLIENLDNLPFPSRHLTHYQKYFSVLSPRRPVTTMFTSRGCPYQCLFCDRPQLGKNFRARSAKNVVKEIFIYDDTFGVDRQRVLDICSQIKKRKIDIAWDIRTRVNTVDEEILKALKQAGCQRIHYGVEAGTQKILNVLRKGITIEQVERAFKMTNEAGIQTAAYFMVGSPTETKEDILQTIKFMKKINPDYVHVTITTPFPATDLYTMALREKIITNDVWREFARNPRPEFQPPAYEENFTREELMKILIKTYRSYYLSPSYVLRRIKEMRTLAGLKNNFRAGLKLLSLILKNV